MRYFTLTFISFQTLVCSVNLNIMFSKVMIKKQSHQNNKNVFNDNKKV